MSQIRVKISPTVHNWLIKFPQFCDTRIELALWECSPGVHTRESERFQEKFWKYWFEI